jgi:hypothetical protein
MHDETGCEVWHSLHSFAPSPEMVYLISGEGVGG